MVAKPLELFSTCAGIDQSMAVDAGRPERRKRVRTQVHWTILLFRETTSKAVTTITQNLSSSGFYCVTGVAFTPGERLVCTIKVPTHDPNGKHLEQKLECQVRVLRVEPQDTEGMFGLACQIEDYHFIQTAATELQ